MSKNKKIRSIDDYEKVTRDDELNLYQSRDALHLFCLQLLDTLCRVGVGDIGVRMLPIHRGQAQDELVT